MYLEGKHYSVTCDHWTSLAQENYGALTLHLIDNFELKTFILSCRKHPNGATAAELETQLTSDLTSWGLDSDLLFSIVTDTASNMNSLGEKIMGWNEGSFVRHHYCADHILQLTAVKAFSGDISEGRPQNRARQDPGEDNSVTVLKKSRDLVSYFHSSTIATEKLITAQKQLNPTSIPLKLVQDVKTRWWSTHSMITRILELREPLQHLFQNEFRHREGPNTQTQLEKLQLMDSDFQHLENLEFVLKPFQEAQRALEGEHYVNLSLLPLVISEMKDQLGISEAAASQNTQQQLIALLADMQEDFQERWGERVAYSTDVIRSNRRRQKGIPTYAFWALVLDPRTKTKVSKILHENEITTLWLDITTAIRLLLQREARTTVAPEENEQEHQHVEVPRRKKQKPSFLAKMEEEFDATPSEPTIAQVIDAEITAFQAEKGQPMFNQDNGYNNPLDWWRIKENKYPNVWKLARCVLAIPATSAPSERVFSAAANIVNKKRVRLKPETVDLLIFLRGNKEFVEWN